MFLSLLELPYLTIMNGEIPKACLGIQGSLYPPHPCPSAPVILNRIGQKAAPAQSVFLLGKLLCVLCPALFLCFWFSLFQWEGLTCALEELFPALEKCLAQTYGHIPVQSDLSQDGLEPP